MSRAFPLWLALPVAAVILVAIVYVALTEIAAHRANQAYAGLTSEQAEFVKLLLGAAENFNARMGVEEQYDNWTDRFFAWFEEAPLGVSVVVSLALAVMIAFLSIPLLLWRNGRQLADLNAAQAAMANQAGTPDGEPTTQSRSPDKD